MKLKNLSLIASTIALALTATSFSIKADPANADQLVAQAQRRQQQQGLPAPQLPAGVPPLSQKQQQDIAAIQTDIRKKLENVFTKEQQQQIRTGLQAGQTPQDVFSKITISEKQKKDIQSILQEQQQRIAGVLTDEQKTKLSELRRQQIQQMQRSQPQQQRQNR